NPMLEIDESFEEPADAPDSTKVAEGLDHKAEKSADPDYEDEFAGSDNWNEKDIPEELSVDSHWDDIYTNTTSTSSSSSNSDFDEMDFDSRNAETLSLQDHLNWQLNLTPMSDLDR